MTQEPFNEIFQKVKNGLKFEHRTLEYDPELQRIKQEVSSHENEINNMFLTKAEPYWRRVLLGEINEAFIFFSYDSYIDTWFIGREQKLYFEWKSDCLVKTGNELSEEYFIWGWAGNLKSPLPMAIIMLSNEQSQIINYRILPSNLFLTISPQVKPLTGGGFPSIQKSED